VRVGDLTSRKPVGEPLTGHTRPVQAVATTMMNNRPVAVTGGVDTTVRVWDLITRQQTGEPLSGHTGSSCWLLRLCPQRSCVAVVAAPGADHSSRC